MLTQSQIQHFQTQGYLIVQGFNPTHFESIRLASERTVAKGRSGDWAREAVKLPTAKMLDAVTAVGFRGLWLDRLGYPEQAAGIEAEIAALTGKEPVQSSDGRFWFFDLRDHAREVEQRLGADGVAQLRRETLRNVG